MIDSFVKSLENTLRIINNMYGPFGPLYIVLFLFLLMLMFKLSKLLDVLISYYSRKAKF